MHKANVTVIMSVYRNDKPEFLEQAILSLINQTYRVLVYIIVDGKIDENLNNILIKYQHEINLIYRDANLGLAQRLNELIDITIKDPCIEYIARMDADDICRLDRIEKQISYLNQHAEVSVLGSDMIEIDHQGKHIFHKKMLTSHDDIVSSVIRRCPVNHPSVIIRADVFRRGFRYNSNLRNTQDFYLWVDLIVAGFKFANINEPLLYFRIDNDFYNRRGVSKVKNDIMSRLYAFKMMNNFSINNFFHVLLMVGLRLSPAFIKKIAYKYLR